MEFKDHFSQHADLYAKYRPAYPDELFAFLGDNVGRHARAWDCATGSGQAALALTKHFDEVIATDASTSQIQNAVAHSKIRYLVAPAEFVPAIADKSINLLTVASAIHWFDFERFYSEARRVLAPGGLIAVWVFHETDGNREFDHLLYRFEHEIVGPYFPEEMRKWIWTDYKTIPFPFEEIISPDFVLKFRWTVEDVLGYLSTWSSVRRYMAQHAQNPINLIRTDLERIAREEGGIIQRGWKLCTRFGRIAR